jgi:hypothetical protein
MTLSEALGQIKTIFLDTARVIYFIEAHDQFDRIKDNLTWRFRITRGGGFKKDCIESFGDTNTGDPQILYDFVK